MFRTRTSFISLALTLLAISVFLAAGPLPAVTAQGTASQQLILRTTSPADYGALRNLVKQSGGTFIVDRPDLNLMIVSVPNVALLPVEKSSHIAGMALDHAQDVVGPSMRGQTNATSGTPQRVRVNIQAQVAPERAPNVAQSVTPDPAFTNPGLMWNQVRIHADQSWQQPVGLGAPQVLVGVVDTGLDYTHIELQNHVSQTVDFTLTENPPLCPGVGLPTDAQLKIAFGAPGADLDFNGHGTWIAGNIAAKINITGTNGIVPNVGLVSLKVAQNCGLAYDSSILSAILYAADNGIDVVNLSFSHYLNRSDPAQETLYETYVQVIAYARSKGTTIVAGAGDEHARIGDGGQVIGHGTLSAVPGGTDNFGLWQIPGGIPGVVDVSATNNVVNTPSSSCPADSLAAGTHQWCKPTSDAHQPAGAGLENQLAFYSNYGPRIDLAAPGGAAKFNLPSIDRGGAEGWPWTGVTSVEGGSSVADGYNAWQEFGINSNFATQIPCFTFTGSLVFPNNQCYAIQQGSTLAASHVSAVLALTASTSPQLWRKPDLLIAQVKTRTITLSGNTTTQASATDTTAGDLGGAVCTGGYCHLGGAVIPDSEAFGTGLVNALGPYRNGLFLPLIMR